MNNWFLLPKLAIEHHPPYFNNKKGPDLEGEGSSVIGVALPTRHRAFYENGNLSISLAF